MKARILIISEKIQIKLLWMLGASALGRPRGMVMGREEGGVFRMGNTCIPVTDSF